MHDRASFRIKGPKWDIKHSKQTVRLVSLSFYLKLINNYNLKLMFSATGVCFKWILPTPAFLMIGSATEKHRTQRKFSFFQLAKNWRFFEKKFCMMKIKFWNSDHLPEISLPEGHVLKSKWSARRVLSPHLKTGNMTDL